MSSDDRAPENGFEFDGTFYRWHVSDLGKDLMLIDRISGLPVTDFFELIEDDVERTRTPVMLTMIATSIRNGHPDWSVERIVRTVLNLRLSDVHFVGGDVEEGPALPPVPPLRLTDDSSGSSSSGSSSSSTPPADSNSPTYSATRA